MISYETLGSFIKGNLELWCPKMIILQQESDKPIKYAGSGLIRQNKDRRLEFVLIENPSPSLAENIKRMMRNDGEVGVLLPADKYYSLEADDISGCKWKSNRLQISQSFAPGGSIELGEIYFLEQIESSESHNATIKLEILSDVKLPFTEVTKKTVRMGTDELVSWERNMARFKVGQVELTITNENNILTVVATSEGTNFPAHFETRILEALQFVAARTLSWGILQKTSDGKSVTCLRSPDKGQFSTNLSLPIDYIHLDLAGKWVWLLFEKYLEHICDFESKDRFQMHPLSAWLHYVRNSSTGSIFAKGLGLGIAVEGILKCKYSKIGRSSPEDVKAVEAMIDHVNYFSGGGNILARTLGALREMQSIRATDRLIALQAEGFVRAANVQAWKAIRNSAAHARPPESEEIQEWIDYCYKTEVLINHLIFHAIGYEGKFTDYGNRKQNWPLSQYPFSNTISS